MLFRSHWRLPGVTLNTAAAELSGGEITKVFLAGLSVHSPDIVLLDEPTNHLDQTARELLYQYIRQSKATIVAVSHDITLLEQLQPTCELSEHGIKTYGGNYSFYVEQKKTEINALDEHIREEEKMLRLARKKAEEVNRKQEKRAVRGEKNKARAGEARIIINAKGNSSENTAASLKEKHADIIDKNRDRLAMLKNRKEQLKELKIDFDDASIRSGKLLVEALQINFSYRPTAELWAKPLDVKLHGNDRIHILGDNGSGKTTLIKLLIGLLTPSCGQINRTNFGWIYLDQNYTQADTDCTVWQLAESRNVQHLPEHEVKLRLNRFLFPSEAWGKNCKSLSGGERMRLYLCCLMIGNQTPDLIVLDEPTNNLDISSLRILTQTIRDYRGSLLVVSHDRHFTDEIGITESVTLGKC